MDNSNNQIGAASDSPNYNFSNFFCHPDFITGKSGSTLNLVFAGTPEIAQGTKSDQEPEEAAADKKTGL